MSAPAIPPDVLALLPHRYPFLLVDRVTAVEHGERAVGLKRVTSGEWGAAHPGGIGTAGAMPHLLVVEALAQLTAAILVGLVPGGEAVGYFMGLERVRCRGTVRAGDLLRLEVRLVRFRRGICRTQGEAWVVDERDGADVEAAPRTRVVRAGLTTVVRPVEPHERR